jgi:hypothetical protein
MERRNILNENLLILGRRLDRRSSGLLSSTTATGSKVDTAEKRAQDTKRKLDSQQVSIGYLVKVAGIFQIRCR